MWLPQALSIGVSYETFWALTPMGLTPFVEAFRQKQEYEAQAFQERINFSAWLNGIYISHAVAANFSKNAVYPDKPFDLTGKDEHPKNDAMKFEAWALAFNHEFEKA